MSDFWTKVQSLFKERGRRYYGNGGTIHRTEKLNVELDKTGKVVAVWFRCQPLPFDQSIADDSRAKEMNRMYETPMCELHGVDVKDIS